MNKFSDSLGPTSVRTNNLRQLIRKCTTLTLAVQTSPTARLHLHHHGGALRRQVLKVSDISAVPTCRRLAAPRTGAYFRSHRRDHPTIAVPLDPKNPRARPGSPIHVFSHARLSARCPIKPTSTESEADPPSIPSPPGPLAAGGARSVPAHPTWPLLTWIDYSGLPEGVPRAGPHQTSAALTRVAGGAWPGNANLGEGPIGSAGTLR